MSLCLVGAKLHLLYKGVSNLIIETYYLNPPLNFQIAVYSMQTSLASILKATVIFSGAPLAVAFVILALSPSEEITTTLDEEKESLNIYKVLKDNDIDSQTILSGIETGAPVLAKTNNSIIAAPYHRNIVGNRFLIEVMLEEDLGLVERKIIDKSVDIIVVGNDPHLLILKGSAGEEAFINKLYSSDTPTWLEVVHDNIESGYRVFRVRGSS